MVHYRLTLLLFTFLTHNNQIRDLEAVSHHHQVLPLFTIPPCIHLTKNSSKWQLPLSAFIAFLALQMICRLPFRCCTDMQNLLPSFIVTRDFQVYDEFQDGSSQIHGFGSRRGHNVTPSSSIMSRHAAVSDSRNQYSQNILPFEIRNDSMTVLSIAKPTLRRHMPPGKTRSNQDHLDVCPKQLSSHHHRSKHMPLVS